MQTELPQSPALAPAADGVGVQRDAGAGGDVGQGGLLVQEQGQTCALPEVAGRGAGTHELLCLGQELGREERAVQR